MPKTANTKTKKVEVMEKPIKVVTRKTMTGTVVSDKMQKTVVVAVERKIQHPLYKKIIRDIRKFKADTNGMEIKTGDLVKIEQWKKMSKDKNFRVIEKIDPNKRKGQA